MTTEIALLQQRLANVEAFLRDTYAYQSAPAAAGSDGVPQPCSWCGSHQSVCDKQDPAMWQVYCNACEYGTDWYTTPQAAWTAWNSGVVLNLSEEV